MIATVTNHVSQGLQGLSSPYNLMRWYRTNFNMPVPNIFSGSTFTRYIGTANPVTSGTSYNLSTFSPGMEICVGLSCWDFENTDPVNSYSLSTQLYNRWTDPSLNSLFWGYNGNTFTYTIPASYYVFATQAINIGCAGWEVSSSGTYHYRSSATGTPTISPVDTSVTMSNVPSTSYPSYNSGSIWVEGATLSYINTNYWKHSIVGTYMSTYAGTSKAGSIWLDSSSNLLCWVGADGYVYRSQWSIKQFASNFSNGPTGSTYAGTSKTGTIWVDGEFGLTHIAYIGTDGYKYLMGAGNYPYV